MFLLARMIARLALASWTRRTVRGRETPGRNHFHTMRRGFMFSLLFSNKRIDSQATQDIRELKLRIEMLESVVSGQAATISRLTVSQEKAPISKDPIHGKVPEKQASTPRSAGLLSGVGSFRTGSTMPGSESRTESDSSPTIIVADDPTPSHHHHVGSDSGYSDSAFSPSGCD